MQEQSSGYSVPHNRLTFGEEEVRAVSDVVKSGYWACGPKVKELESTLKKLSERKHTVSVSSGFSALRLSLLALGVGEGDEIIVPAYSCVALANAALSIGAVPVPADIRQKDWNVDPEGVEKVLTEKTKAIIAVHTFGAPALIEELKKFKVPVIEDCAHAFGLGHLGGMGDVSILSFYATKLIAAGEGGAVLTDREDVAAFINDERDYVDKPQNALRFNDKMTDLEAALALCQLGRLPQMLSDRVRVAEKYHKALGVPQFEKDRVWYRYVVEVKGSANDVIDALRNKGIHAERPLELWVEDAQMYPVARHAYESLVSLPIYPTLTEAEQDQVCDAFNSVVGLS